MEDAFRSLQYVAKFMDYAVENGLPQEEEAPILPESIGYVSGLCILAFFGTLGNILILIMFSKQEFCHTSYSVYIRFAAVSDTVFMLINISEDVIDHVVSGYSTTMLFNISYTFSISWSVTKGTFRSASPWIIVALAVDRCVAIWKPLNRTFYCTKRTGIIITTAIVLISLGVELVLYLAWETAELSTTFLLIKRLVSETGLPCITMLIPNVLVIYKIQQSLSFIRTFSTTENESRKVAKSVRPLLVVSCLAFSTLLPISITEMVEVLKIHNQYNDADIQDDFPSFTNRNESFGRMINDRHFTNDTLFNNITSLGSLHENDQRKNPSWGTDVDRYNRSSNLIDQYNRSSNLIENTDLEEDAHTADEMNDEVKDGMNENEHGNRSYENTDETSNRFGQEIDDRHEDNEDELEEEEEEEDEHEDEEGEEEEREEEEEEEDDDDDDDQDVIDIIWKTCNFIYMCNFSQNFYLLVISSGRYRQILFQMFYCKQKKLVYSGNNAQTKTQKTTNDLKY